MINGQTQAEIRVLLSPMCKVIHRGETGIITAKLKWPGKRLGIPPHWNVVKRMNYYMIFR
jgi:hypothetical protein